MQTKAPPGASQAYSLAERVADGETVVIPASDDPVESQRLSMIMQRAFRVVQNHRNALAARTRRATPRPCAGRAQRRRVMRTYSLGRSTRPAVAAASGSSPPSPEDSSPGSSRRGASPASALDDPPPAGRIRVRHSWLVASTVTPTGGSPTAPSGEAA